MTDGEASISSVAPALSLLLSTAAFCWSLSLRQVVPLRLISTSAGTSRSQPANSTRVMPTF
jgi:hypothetical protein